MAGICGVLGSQALRGKSEARGVDYPMDVLGLSIGRAITGGFLAGKYVAAL